MSSELLITRYNLVAIDPTHQHGPALHLEFSDGWHLTVDLYNCALATATELMIAAKMIRKYQHNHRKSCNELPPIRMPNRARGGYARAESLSPERRSEIARAAALARHRPKDGM